MEHSETKKNIKETILEKISSKEISMRPRYYYWARMFLLGAVSVGIFITSTFILNFILFNIRINSQEDLLFFGVRGWGAFLYFFPWTLLLIDAVLVLALLALLRQFSFGYKNPLLFLLLVMVALIGSVGLFIDRATGINERFMRAAEERRLPPPLHQFYGGVHHGPPPEFKELIELRRQNMRMVQ